MVRSERSPTFDDKVSRLESRWGDIDPTPNEHIPANDPVQPNIICSSYTSNSLNDILDWLGKSDLGGPIYKHPPTDVLGDTDEGVIQTPMKAPRGTSMVAPPKLQMHTFIEPLSLPDTNFQPPVGGVASGNKSMNKEGILVPKTAAPNFQQTLGNRATGSDSVRSEGAHVPRTPGRRVFWIGPRPRKDAVLFESTSASPCTAAGIVCQPTENKDVTTRSIEEVEAMEWHDRQQRTGAVARQVFYDESDNPKDDLFFRGGAGAHMVVEAVRDGGLASKEGVKVGDRLVSIDGSKAFSSLPADTLLERLKSPTLLIFAGFVGKVRAEVRLYQPAICGLGARQSALLKGRGGQDSHYTIAEERVFRKGNASIFLSTSIDNVKNEKCSDCQVKSELQDEIVSHSDSLATTATSTSCPSLFELQSVEATKIVRKAMILDCKSAIGTLV